MDALSKEADELFQIKVSKTGLDKLIEKMFVITDDMSNRKKDSQFLLQQQLRHAYEMDDLGNLRGTGFGFINAVSDMSTHKPPVRRTDNSKENSFMAVVDSPLLLDTAHKLIREYV